MRIRLRIDARRGEIMSGRSSTVNSTLAGLFTAAMLLWSHIANAKFVISTQPTSNATCSSGVCSPTARNAVLNVTDLENALAASDTRITTGSGAHDIVVEAGFSWASAY